MIAKGIPHRHGAKLARYMVTGKDGEHAELWQLRGFATTNIVDAFQSVHVMAKATKCRDVFLHVVVRNPEGERLTRPQWEYAANSIERMLGLGDHPRAISFHIDAATGHEHMHAAWSRICTETMKAKPLPFFKTRLKNACRHLEKHLGLTPVRNQRESRIQYAPTRAEEQQARRLGLNIHVVRESIRECFESSDCGKSFQSALAQKGLTLGRGDRRDFLIIDQAAGVHALGKRIVGASAAEIRQRLADLDRNRLPTAEQCRVPSLRQLPALPETQPMPVSSRLVASRCEDYSPQPAPTAGFDTAADEDLRMGQGEYPARPAGQQEGNLGPEPHHRVPAVEAEIHNPEPHLNPPRQPSFGDKLRAQFRSVMKALTRRAPSPKPKNRRKKDETGRGFTAVAAALFRRLAPIFDAPYPPWDAIAWLHTWGCTDLEIDQNFADISYERSSDFSPHP